MHVDPNNWFCYYKTLHLYFTQTHMILNLILQLSVPVLYLICSHDGHLFIFLIPYMPVWLESLSAVQIVWLSDNSEQLTAL